MGIRSRTLQKYFLTSQKMLINLLILGKLNSINSIQHHRLTYFFTSRIQERSLLFCQGPLQSASFLFRFQLSVSSLFVLNEVSDRMKMF